jgi:branched-chain amino acid transport system permease protein
MRSILRQFFQAFRGAFGRVPDWVRGPLMTAILILFGLALEPFPRLLLEQMLIVGLFAMSLNLIMGYGGMVHFGHAAFYGLGAYTYAILSARQGWPPLVAMALAPLVAMAVAVPIGWFSVRRVRLYFSILTLAFGQLIYLIVFQAREFTGGDDGIHGLTRPDFLQEDTVFFVFAVLVFAGCFLALRTLTRAPFVLTLRAIRENSERAQFIGIDIRRHQLITFVIGAGFAGIAGMLLAMHSRSVGVEMLIWSASSEPVLASLLGGMYSMSGPLVGAGLLIYLNVTITRFTTFWPAVLGLLTILIVLFAPNGLVGALGRYLGAEQSVEEEG